MNKYKLVASDLDGTLVGSNLKLGDKNTAALKRFREMGVHFVPCTGRTLCEMSEVVNNPDVRYYIYSNGAGIWDKTEDKRTFLGFSTSVAAELIDILKSFDCYIIIHHGGKTYVDIEMTDENVERYNICFNVKELIRDYSVCTADLKAACFDEGTESFSVFFRSPCDTEECKKLIGAKSGVSCVDSWPCNIEIFRSDISKGDALLKISEMLGIDISETISIGDSGNDISMTRVAGLGLAVLDSCDALKAVANEIICSNDEGVADYVLKHYFE